VSQNQNICYLLAISQNGNEKFIGVRTKDTTVKPHAISAHVDTAGDFRRIPMGSG